MRCSPLMCRHCPAVLPHGCAERLRLAIVDDANPVITFDAVLAPRAAYSQRLHSSGFGNLLRVGIDLAELDLAARASFSHQYRIPLSHDCRAFPGSAAAAMSAARRKEYMLRDLLPRSRGSLQFEAGLD